MISDVLSDALHEIERYQKDYPENYGSRAEMLVKCTAVMRSTQLVFDAEPSVCDEIQVRIGQLEAAICRLDLAEIESCVATILREVAAIRDTLARRDGLKFGEKGRSTPTLGVSLKEIGDRRAAALIAKHN